MNGNTFYKKRILPCLNELYSVSECINGKKYSFDQLFEYAPYMKEEDNKKTLPVGAFYIDNETYDKIIAKHSKGLRYYWRFPYRSEIYPKGEEWEELKSKYQNNPEDKEIAKKYEDTIEYMRRDELWHNYYSRLCEINKKRENKEISGPEAKKMRDALAKEFKCQHRSYERESISFACAFYGPTLSREYYDKVKMYYEGKTPEGIDYSLAYNDANVFIKFEENVSNKNQINKNIL